MSYLNNLSVCFNIPAELQKCGSTVSLSAIQISSQESKYGDGAVVVMEHMLKPQSEPLAWGYSILQDKAFALQTDTNCVKLNSRNKNNLLTYEIISPQLPAGNVYLSKILRTNWWKSCLIQRKCDILTKCTTDLPSLSCLASYAG